jgi:hypothetical protein
MRTISGTIALLVILSPVGGRTLAAQLTDPAAAEALFQEGRRLLKSRDPDVAAACAKFDESLRLDPAIGTLINVAACQERLGRTATAWQHWRAAADQLATADRRRTMALNHAMALEKVLPRLVVTLGPNIPDDVQVEVRRDGIRLGRASLGLPLPLDPGPHRVTVLSPGRQPRNYDLVIAPRETQNLLVEPGPEALAQPSSSPPERQVAAAPPPAAPATVEETLGPPATFDIQTPAVPAAPRPTSWRTVASWGLIGAGAAALGTAGYFGSQALAARRDARTSCPGVADERVCHRSGTPALDRDRRFSLRSDVAVVVGALLFGSGLFLLRDHYGEEATGGSAIYLAPRPKGGEAGLVTRF